MKGFWKASSSFCKEADLDTFVMHIGESDFFGNPKVFILMLNSNGIIINDIAEMQLSGINLQPYCVNCRKFDVTFNWLYTDGFSFFPNEQKIHYYPKKGKIIMMNGEEITAVLYKDYSMSDIKYEDEQYDDIT
jgi:hypothetical protein